MKPLLLIPILICAIVFAAYTPVLFNFFVGDDFVHLVWLRGALYDPQLVWRNFHTSWLDSTVSLFYRPLISVFMLADYAIWRTNGLGFHLTNVLLLLASTLAVFFITRELLPDDDRLSSASRLLWPSAAALIFGLNPLHPESVSWITGRVDSIVTMFCLFSLWFFMRWRRDKKLPALITSLLSACAAMLSKEMAVTIPFTLTLYELIIGQIPVSDSWLNKIRRTAAATAPFWLLLVFYFILRRLALGTFIGGYDDSLLGIADWKIFLIGWQHALDIFLVPVNREMIRSKAMLIAWRIVIVICAAEATRKCIINPALRTRAAFLFAWTIVCLLPVYKLFTTIADDLQGTRFAFLASAPLACLLTLAMAPGADSDQKKALRFLAPAAMAALCALSLTTLLWNNSAWVAAGETSNAIRSQLERFYSKTAGDPHALIVGLPDRVHGAYVARNALHGMTKYPQMSRDIQNCQMIDQAEQVLPLGYLKESLANSAPPLTTLTWQKQTRKLLAGTVAAKPQSLMLEGRSLFEALKPADSSCSIALTTDGDTEITPLQGNRTVAVLLHLHSLPCFTTDFLAVDLDADNPGIGGRADLYYTNNMSADFDFYHRSYSTLGGAGQQSLIFTLRALPEWTFGGATDTLKLSLPKNFKGRLKAIRSLAPQMMMPTLSFADSGFFAARGYANLSQKAQRCSFTYSSAVPGATGVLIEVTKPNSFFGEMNTKSLSLNVMKDWTQSGASGTVVLERGMFSQVGLYQMRLWAVDAQGNRLGVSGDHVCIAVASKSTEQR